MAYPTFAAFVAPYDEIGAAQMTQWMDTLSSICNFTEVNLTDFEAGPMPTGDICLTSYFDSSQAVIATMIMSDMLMPLAAGLADDDQIGNGIIMKAQQGNVGFSFISAGMTSRFGMGLVAISIALSAVVMRSLRRCSELTYATVPLVHPSMSEE